jgi:hypothetical protein
MITRHTERITATHTRTCPRAVPPTHPRITFTHVATAAGRTFPHTQVPRPHAQTHTSLTFPVAVARADFERRFLQLLSFRFREFSPVLALEILSNPIGRQPAAAASRLALPRTHPVPPAPHLSPASVLTLGGGLVVPRCGRGVCVCVCVCVCLGWGG